MSAAVIEDEVTLTLIANGLLQIEEGLETGKPLGFPYPDPIEEGLHRFSLTAVEHGLSDSPQSVPDLLDWCHRPLRTWRLDLPSEIDLDEPLLAFGETTPQCQQLALDAADIAGEFRQNLFFHRLITACQSRDDQDGYVALRRFIIENPVVTRSEIIHRTAEDVALQGLSDLLTDAYIVAPPSASRNKQFFVCDNCGYLLRISADGDWICGNQSCRDECPTAKKGKAIPIEDEVRVLRREIHRFMAQPGRAELRLFDSLTSAELPEVELWPSFDAYDLRATFPDGEVWAIDVKDWKRPLALVREIRKHPIPASPPSDKRFFVVPNERGKQQPSYVQTCRNLLPGVPVLLERDLFRKVRSKLRKGHSSA